MPRFSKTFIGVVLAVFAVAGANAQTPVGSWTGLYGGVSGHVQGATSTASGTNTYTTTEIVVEPSGGPTDTVEEHILAEGQTNTVIHTEAIADHRTRTIGGIGAHLGYNYQSGHVVVGAEGDIQYADYTSGGSGLGNGFAGPDEGYATRSHSTVVGTLRARGGVAFDQVLVFGTGGLALTDLRHTVLTNSGFVDSRHQTTGWVAGGGAEVRITPRISLVAMALYTDFGKQTLSGGDGTSGFTTTFQTHHVTGSLGVSMLF